MKQQLSTNKTLSPKKSLGQNFIKDNKFLEKLVSKLELTKNKKLIEIGPGKGALTDKLVQKYDNDFFLIEKDRKLSELLIKKYSENRNIKIFNEDALDFRYNQFFKNQEAIIIGNLPFNISSQLLINWLSYKNWPSFYSKMYLMFQYELGERIISSKNSKKYGKLSILVQSRFQVNKILKAPSKIFFPEPKVDGLILEFIPIIKYKNLKIENLKKVLEEAFKHRRKKIKKSLSPYSHLITDWSIKSELRAENLDIDDYCDLARKIS